MFSAIADRNDERGGFRSVMAMERIFCHTVAPISCLTMETETSAEMRGHGLINRNCPWLAG